MLHAPVLLIYQAKMFVGRKAGPAAQQTFWLAKLIGTGFRTAFRAFWGETRKGFGVNCCVKRVTTLVTTCPPIIFFLATSLDPYTYIN